MSDSHQIKPGDLVMYPEDPGLLNECFEFILSVDAGPGGEYFYISFSKHKNTSADIRTWPLQYLTRDLDYYKVAAKLE